MLEFITKKEYLEFSEKRAEDLPKNFKNLCIEASNYINTKTVNRIDPHNPSEKVKYVTYLIIELLISEKKQLEEVGNLKSQNIEGWSETYSTPEEIKNDFQNKKYAVLQEYLLDEIGVDGQPLLYLGVL